MKRESNQVGQCVARGVNRGDVLRLGVVSSALALLASPVLASAVLASAVLASAVLGGCSGEEECNSIACAQSESANQSRGGSGQGGTTNGGLIGTGAEPTAGTGGALGDGEACRAILVESETKPVNIHIMLDRSLSMLEAANATDASFGTRWDAITTGLRTFLTSDRVNGAQVGIQFFGHANGVRDDCEVAKYAVPAVPVGPLAMTRDQLLAAIDATRPGSLTPTKPAITGALEYALGVAKLPENAGRATVVVLATDGVPSECGVFDAQGRESVSFQQIVEVLQQYSKPAKDAAGNPVQPPILTYIIGTADLSPNANALAAAGGGETFLVGRDGGDVQAEFLDAMLRIVAKPLTCELDVPQTAPDTGESVDFDRVKVSAVGATSGITREIPQVRGVGSCSQAPQGAWYYDDALAPKKMFFCPVACNSLGANSLKVELGCEPTRILR